MIQTRHAQNTEAHVEGHAFFRVGHGSGRVRSGHTIIHEISAGKCKKMQL